jgi:hypothetical protein
MLLTITALFNQKQEGPVFGRFWPIYLLDSMAAVEKCRQFSAWLPLDSAAAICWTIHYSLTRSRSSLPGLK